MADKRNQYHMGPVVNKGILIFFLTLSSLRSQNP